MFSPHSLSNNKISLDLLPYGLTVQSLILKTAAGDRDLLVGPKDPQEHHFETGPNGRGFINQTVGRYANRSVCHRSDWGKKLSACGSQIAQWEDGEGRHCSGFDRECWSRFV